MKNIFKTLLASLILMTSCTADNDSEVAIAPSVKQFFASIEASSTRTYADEDGNLLWNANDMITAFYGDTYPRKFKFMGTDGKNYGQFDEIDAPTGSYTANSLTANYAIYPYHEATEISNSGVISYVIPATQSYKENSFGLGANVMVAVTKNIDDNFLAFKNLGGYFEFSLYGNTTVKSIEFKGNNDEELAGAVNITASNQSVPTFEFVGETTKTLTLDCGENGVELSKDENNPTKFWFVVPAIEYTKGITITITDVDGGTMEKTTKNSITVNRSSVKPLRAFLVETTSANTPPNNQIWYTTSDGRIVTINDYSANLFNIKSNTYEEGKGVITFEGNITEIVEYAFQDCTNLTSVILPNSTTAIRKFAFARCSGLTSVIIPNNVTSIGDSAFRWCSSLTSINIPESVTRIEQCAFNNCSSLSSLNIPQNITRIEDGTFSKCAITSLSIPENVTYIGQHAFYYCTSLTSIDIPNKVDTMGSQVFEGCSSLTSVYCRPVTPPVIAFSAFKDNSANRIIYVPQASIDAYKTANNWQDYANEIVGY